MILSYLYDAHTLQTYALPRGLTILGRSSRSDIRVQCKEVSRAHCAILVDDTGEVLINDLGSSYGTKINSSLVVKTTKLKSGAALQVGSRYFLLKHVDLSPENLGQAAILPVNLLNALGVERRVG